MVWWCLLYGLAHTVTDVCDWVDGMGLSQYRKKFVHHFVDGRLLLRLNDALLRTELGIGPLVSEQLCEAPMLLVSLQAYCGAFSLGTWCCTRLSTTHVRRTMQLSGNNKQPTKRPSISMMHSMMHITATAHILQAMSVS